MCRLDALRQLPKSDGVVDIQLIADLHKSEVFRAGHQLGVPNSILVAAPSADLWQGQTDEQELGFTYDCIELFTGVYLKAGPTANIQFRDSLGADAKKQFDEWAAVCEGVHRRNAHKLDSPKTLGHRRPHDGREAVRNGETSARVDL